MSEDNASGRQRVPVGCQDINSNTSISFENKPFYDLDLVDFFSWSSNDVQRMMQHKLHCIRVNQKCQTIYSVVLGQSSILL